MCYYFKLIFLSPLSYELRISFGPTYFLLFCLKFNFQKNGLFCVYKDFFIEFPFWNTFFFSRRFSKSNGSLFYGRSIFFGSFILSGGLFLSRFFHFEESSLLFKLFLAAFGNLFLHLFKFFFFFFEGSIFGNHIFQLHL